MSADEIFRSARRDALRDTDDPRFQQRISGPGELVQAIPYLLGFHPRESVVLVGLQHGQLVVTARLDLDERACAQLSDTVRAMAHGGTTEVIAALYTDDPELLVDRIDGQLPLADLAAEIGRQVGWADCAVAETLLVSGGRWWSYSCDVPDCCPPEGRPLQDAPSAFAAAATYAGVVALPSREALAAQLEPCSERSELRTLIAEAQVATAAAAVEGLADRHERSVKRAIFAAARASSERNWVPPDDAAAARFGVALRSKPVRDPVWMAVDGGRLDGRELWRDLARRLPPPYDAPALFLFGWRAWRAGDGTVAGMAAERAVESDPSFTMADLLLAAVTHGLSPRRVPRLRHQRSA